MFEFKGSSCVVVGTFNITIIQPKWLVESEIIESDSNFHLQFDMQSPGIRFKLPDKDGQDWNVRPDRLSVSSNVLGVDCGKPISEVLSRLPWTPIMAVGCNVNFGCPVKDFSSLDHLRDCSNIFNTSNISSDYKFKQRTWHFSVEREDTVFNVQIAETEDEIELLLNVHADTKEAKGIKKGNEIARNACANFVNYTNEATTLAKDLLSKDISNDIFNA